jgi:putative SOS response-associated peptidase YedK
MPVILSSVNYDLWLDPGFRDVAAVTEMLQPFYADRMRRYPVSERVNNVANDNTGCSEPVEVVPPAQTELF